MIFKIKQKRKWDKNEANEVSNERVQWSIKKNVDSEKPVEDSAALRER